MTLTWKFKQNTFVKDEHWILGEYYLILISRKTSEEDNVILKRVCVYVYIYVCVCVYICIYACFLFISLNFVWLDGLSNPCLDKRVFWTYGNPYCSQLGYPQRPGGLLYCRCSWNHVEAHPHFYHRGASSSFSPAVGLKKAPNSPLHLGHWLSQCPYSSPPLHDLRAWGRTRKFLRPKECWCLLGQGLLSSMAAVYEPQKWWPLGREGNTYLAAKWCTLIWQLRRPCWVQSEGHKLPHCKTGRRRLCCSHRPGWSGCWCCSGAGSRCRWSRLVKDRLLASDGWIHCALP